MNLSASNLLDPGFTELVSELLEKHRVPPGALVLEITETCIISDYERSKKVIEDLRNLGLVISIDDFGAGFTSLAYLGDLAVGELKLDRIFVTGLALGAQVRDLALIRSTIELGACPAAACRRRGDRGQRDSRSADASSGATSRRATSSACRCRPRSSCSSRRYRTTGRRALVS